MAVASTTQASSHIHQGTRPPPLSRAGRERRALETSMENCIGARHSRICGGRQAARGQGPAPLAAAVTHRKPDLLDTRGCEVADVPSRPRGRFLLAAIDTGGTLPPAM